jgi:hypothetical protein
VLFLSEATMDLSNSGVSTKVKGVVSNEDMLAGVEDARRADGGDIAYGAGFGWGGGMYGAVRGVLSGGVLNFS